MLAASEVSLGFPWRNHYKTHFFSPPGQKEVTGFSSCNTNSLQSFVIYAKFNLTFLQKLYGSCTFHTLSHCVPHPSQMTTGRYATAASSFGTQTTLGVHKLSWGECHLGKHRWWTTSKSPTLWALRAILPFFSIVTVSFYLKVKSLRQNAHGCSWDMRNAKQLRHQWCWVLTASSYLSEKPAASLWWVWN